MKWARFIDGIVQEVVTSDPNDLFHSEVAKLFIEVDDSVTMPIPDISSQEIEAVRVWTENDVRSKLTFAEKVKWDNDAFHEIVSAKIELATPKHVTEVTEILTVLVVSTAISQASMDAILA